MNRLNFVVSCLALVAAVAGFAPDAEASDGRGCTSLSVKRGDHCGTDDSINIVVTNNCSAPLYVKVCSERANHSWDCGVDFSLKPGGKNEGFWSCHATGRYKWATCTDEKECFFKDPKPGE